MLNTIYTVCFALKLVSCERCRDTAKAWEQFATDPSSVVKRSWGTYGLRASGQGSFWRHLERASVSSSFCGAEIDCTESLDLTVTAGLAGISWSNECK